MRFYMKQKTFSWTDKFTIKDEVGNDCFYVEGEMFSFGHKLHVYDMQSQEVAFIHQKVFSFRPRFYINIVEQPELELVRKFTFFHQEYYIEGTSLILEGNFSAHSYNLFNNETLVMNVDKEWFTWGDSYVIDVTEGTDALMCLCIMLAVDCANQDASNASRSATT
jgi:uncharacterized protein YxjI